MKNYSKIDQLCKYMLSVKMLGNYEIFGKDYVNLEIKYVSGKTLDCFRTMQEFENIKNVKHAQNMRRIDAVKQKLCMASLIGIAAVNAVLFKSLENINPVKYAILNFGNCIASSVFLTNYARYVSNIDSVKERINIKKIAKFYDRIPYGDNAENEISEIKPTVDNGLDDLFESQSVDTTEIKELLYRENYIPDEYEEKNKIKYILSHTPRQLKAISK